jgi:hypothetical protein
MQKFYSPYLTNEDLKAHHKASCKEKKPKVNTYHVAQFCGRFYRVLVIGIREEEGSPALVDCYTIDFGRTFSVGKEALYPLHGLFANQSAAVYCCALIDTEVKNCHSFINSIYSVKKVNCTSSYAIMRPQKVG